MPYILNSHTVWDYLINHSLCEGVKPDPSQVELKIAKNFNLLVNPDGTDPLLVKQERFNATGHTLGEFEREWTILEAIRANPHLKELHLCLPEIRHFDATESILVLSYLTDYQDLFEQSLATRQFPTGIAAILGRSLAILHRETYNKPDGFEFCQQSQATPPEMDLHVMQRLDRISPDIFGQVPTEGIKFFALYQRYDSLGQAIAQLQGSTQSCCLIHNDLKLNNVLVHQDWEQSLSSDSTPIIRLIDWERARWGDPAQDVGMVIASYLQFWLNSLVVSPTIALEDSLRMAMTSLDQLQPAIASFMTAYCTEFPNLLSQDSTFIDRVVQNVGMALIQQILAGIQYQKMFGNTGICMLQVAKSLLCRPEQHQKTLFGHPIVQER